MESYMSFAEVYDTFMEETPYSIWVNFIETIWKNYSLEVTDVLDLACGTGNISIELAKKGYSIIGVDLSEEMLSIAKDKSEEFDILFINQDMRNFELYGTVESVVCLCDSINYIENTKDLKKVFKTVNNYLSPAGIFIFDFNTKYKYEHILSDNTFSASFENTAYIWDNYYDSKSMINEYYMDFFVKTNSGLYERFEEIHLQKAYELEEIINLLKESNLEVLNIYDDYKFKEPSENTERICIVAKTNKSLG